MSETASATVTLPVVIPWLLAIMGAAIGAWQFILQQRQAGREPLLRKQLELCFEASDTASRLAMEISPGEWEKAHHTFWRLYWGTLSIVEDADVARAMIALGDLLRPVSNPTLPMKSLEGASYNLALAMRRLILTSWDVKLPSLPHREDKRKQK